MLSENVQLALIVAVPTVLSPLILALLSHWFTRQQKQDEVEARAEEKKTDRAREDEVAARLLTQQELTAARAAAAAEHAAAALAVARETAIKIDGMLGDRDKAEQAKGAKTEAEHSKKIADTLREGQLQGRAEGRADERVDQERLSSSSSSSSSEPVKVADKQTQEATKTIAEATARMANATEAAVSKTTKKV